MQTYSDPSREHEPHALPDVEVFRGYEHECRDCGTSVPLFPDYYGNLYPDQAECPECGHKGVHCNDTKVKWYWWSCFPGCLPDGEPNGPFATEAEAIADAQGEG